MWRAAQNTHRGVVRMEGRSNNGRPNSNSSATSGLPGAIEVNYLVLWRSRDMALNAEAEECCGSNHSQSGRKHGCFTPAEDTRTAGATQGARMILPLWQHVSLLLWCSRVYTQEYSVYWQSVMSSVALHTHLCSLTVPVKQCVLSGNIRTAVRHHWAWRETLRLKDKLWEQMSSDLMSFSELRASWRGLK